MSSSSSSSSSCLASFDNSSSSSLDEVRTIKIIFTDPFNNVTEFLLTSTEYSLSKVISTALDKDIDCKEFPINSNDIITQYALDNCMSYLKYHNGNSVVLPEKPIKEKDISLIWTDKWDVQFIDNIFNNSIKGDKVKQTLLAANYLDIDPLLQLCCVKIACICKDETPERIKELLGHNNVSNKDTKN